MKKRLSVRIVVAFIVCLFLSTFTRPAMADEKVFKWRMANWSSRVPFQEELYHGYVKEVEKASGGRLIIEDIYDGEGVAGAQVLGAVGNGLVEMGSVAIAYHAGELPCGLVEWGLPGLNISQSELWALLHRAGWADVLRKAYAEKNVYWLAELSMPATYVLTKKPIKSLKDFEGMKVRAYGANGKMSKTLGAVPVFIPWAEIYTSLATGVVDGLWGGLAPSDFYEGKFYEIAKYLYRLPVSGSIHTPMIVNLDQWKELPEDLKAILELATNTLHLDYRAAYRWKDADALDEMMKAGLQMSPEPSEGDKSRWEEAAMNTWPEYESDKYSKELLKIQADFLKKIRR